jgi:ribonuclease HI
MKYLKLNNDLLEDVNSGIITTITIANDKDNISIDDEIEFFNEENVAFGKAKVERLLVERSGDTLSEDVKYLLPSPDVELSASDHLKTIFFKYKKYKKPKSLSSNNDLDTTNIKIYADGGSRGNPGPSASGYVLLTEDDQLIKANGVYLGVTTNNQAEYKSIKFALQDALALGAKTVDVYMDSLLVVNQINGKFKIKNEALYPIFRDIKELVTQFDKVTFTHVLRAYNKLADEQVNICLDDALGIT